MKHGVEEQQWLTYRIVIASGAGVLVGAGGCLALLLPHSLREATLPVSLV